MAEGGSVRDSFSKASTDVDELYSEASGDGDKLVSESSADASESFCDPCRHEGEWKAAKGFCQVCEEYLCNHCLRVHRKQKISRSHAILDTNQMPGGQGSDSKQDLCVEVCKEHHPEIIRFYCKFHDEFGCADCMTLNHTTCKKERVQDISTGFQKTKEFKDIDQQVHQLYTELEEMEAELLNNMNNLDKTFIHVQQKIATFRRQINAYLDNIEKKIQNEAAQMKKVDESELNALQAEHHAMKSEIEGMLKALEDSDANANTLFVTAKQAKLRLVTIDKEMTKMKQSQQKQYEFHISDQIQSIISTKTPLGILSHTSSQNIRKMTAKLHQRTPKTHTIDITATYNRSINVKCETDENDCWIKDITLLNSDKIVVTDWNNKNVKLVNINNNRVISCYSTPSEPRGVTALSTNMIAVTLLGERNIHVLNATSKITFQREIKVDKGCWGIAYKNGKFAVSYLYPGRVQIIDINGRLLLTIQPRQGSEYILSRPYYITHEQDTDTVIVSDFGTKKVSVVTLRGEIIRTYKHDTLIDPQGIAITADGVLFVCSSSGGCIHAVSPDFKKSKIIISNDRRYVNPQSLTYSAINQSLYIGNSPGHEKIQNKIFEYYLKVPV